MIWSRPVILKILFTLSLALDIFISLPSVLNFFISPTSTPIPVESIYSRSVISITTSDIPAPSQNISPIKETVYKREAGKAYIDINDDIYLKWYYDCTFSWDKYKDDKFKFLARVFKDPSQKDQFVVLGRMGMICCVADMQPCGFIYNGKGFENLKDGQWYYVTANIVENKKYTYNYEQLAQIINVSLEEARKPTDEHVYIR